MELLEAKRKREGEREKIQPPRYGNLCAITYYIRQGFGIEVDAGMLVDKLRRNGSITDGDYLLRSKESFKQSWEVPMRYPIYFDRLSCLVITESSAVQRIQNYLNSAKESQYFDADMFERPEEVVEGFYLLYPPHLNENNPILAKEPNLVNYAANLEKLAIAAVICHNELTGSDLTFRRVVKSNVFFDIYGFQVYFITLEASDDNDGPLVVCRSRLDCAVNRNDAIHFHGKSIIETVYLDSFHVQRTP